MAPICQRLLASFALAAALHGGLASRVSTASALGEGRDRPTFTAEEAAVREKYASASYALREDAEAELRLESCIEASAPGGACPALLSFARAGLGLQGRLEGCPASEDGGIAAYFNQLGHRTIEEFRDPRPEIWRVVHEKGLECDQLGARDEAEARRIIDSVRMKSRDMYWDKNDIGTAMGFLEDIKELLESLNAATSGTATSPKDFIEQLAPKMALADLFDKADSAKASYEALKKQFDKAAGTAKTRLEGRMERAKRSWAKAQAELDRQ
eukprot:CAMPEP_0171216518 /NCGR_PEP_ID=MMETSP0790-20130122/32221_1 /TAXON_ID=2925 /ORGANISM="Alexandrium catenella, Strain OF101" /LENGTH=269 /DNA_ID=CAMNT_0011682299 /DNA_START=52 /DNA_END=861 /DNA_ORIENTATION=+